MRRCRPNVPMTAWDSASPEPSWTGPTWRRRSGLGLGRRVRGQALALLRGRSSAAPPQDCVRRASLRQAFSRRCPFLCRTSSWRWPSLPTSLADFFAAFFADFLAAFFADFLGRFLRCYLPSWRFLGRLLRGLLCFLGGFLLRHHRVFFLASLPFLFFFRLAIVILLLPPIDVYRILFIGRFI